MSDDYKSQESAGGQNYALLYRVKRKTSGGYDFLDGLTDVVVARSSASECGYDS